MERIAGKAGTAAGWILALGVVVCLAPEAAREAKELATGIVQAVRARLPGGSSPPAPDDLAREVQEMRPAAATW